MIVRNLKELYCIVDSIISTLNKGDSVRINMTYSGNIYKIVDDVVNMCHVTDAICYLDITYTESGVSIRSEGSKGISNWLNNGKQSSYFKVNSYLSFLSSLDVASISKIVYNNTDITSDITNSDNLIHLPNAMEYFKGKKNDIVARVILTNDKRSIPLVYSDGVFNRIVKVKDNHTLYINTDDAIHRIVKYNYISSIYTSHGLPSIMTCIDMYRRSAIENNCKFDIITNNS